MTLDALTDRIIGHRAIAGVGATLQPGEPGRRGSDGPVTYS